MRGVLVVVIGGSSWSVALLLLLFFLVGFSLTDGLPLVLLLGLFLVVIGGLVGYSAGKAYSSLACLSWLLATDESRGSKSVEVQWVWEIYDDRLQLMSRQDALLLDESLDAGDVSQAWLVFFSCC